LKHSPISNKVKAWATKTVMSKTHDAVSKFCNRPQCIEKSAKFMHVFTPCYTSGLCLAMDSLLPREKCKAVFSKYMEDTMSTSLGNVCLREDRVDMAPYFCAELKPDLMVSNLECYMQFQTPHMHNQTSCDPKCVKVWHNTEKKLPKCTEVLTRESQKLYQNMITLMHDVLEHTKDPSARRGVDSLPTHIPTYEESCGGDDEKTFIHTHCDWLDEAEKTGKHEWLVKQEWYESFNSKCMALKAKHSKAGRDDENTLLGKKCAWLADAEKMGKHEWLVKQEWYESLKLKCKCAWLDEVEKAGKHEWLVKHEWYEGLKMKCMAPTAKHTKLTEILV